MGTSRSAGRLPLGLSRVITTAPSGEADTEEIPARRAAKREPAPRAVLRASATTWAVRGVPSEKVTPSRRVKVQVSRSSLTVFSAQSTGSAWKLPLSWNRGS